MGLPAISPLVGVAAHAAAGMAIDAVGEGLSFLNVLRHGRPSEAEKISTEQLQRETSEQLEQLTAALKQRLQANGIDTSLPIEIRADGGGGIFEWANHPRRADIEELIRGDAELLASFNKLAANVRELRARQFVGINDVPPDHRGELTIRLHNDRLDLGLG